MSAVVTPEQRWYAGHAGRVQAVRSADADAPARVRRLVQLAERGLPASYDAATGEFAQTVRGLAGGPDGAGVRVSAQGTNLRYAAMAVLGISRLPEPRQRLVLGGRTAADLARDVARRAEQDADPGAIALAAWVAAEVDGQYAAPLFARLAGILRGGRPLPTVDASWLLTAAVAALPHGDTDDLVRRATGLLLSHQGPQGAYPHVLPPRSQPRWRSHVGSFADQVYPLQALARASVATGDAALLVAADLTAELICERQGPAGQWWWHYDSRDGSVVEPFPVYSVHQHAMAPMVLFDLLEAGGRDHRTSIAAGLAWLDTHPEVVEELISPRFDQVWRKVGRREPRKAARGLGALTTAVRPGLHLPGLDRLLPPVVVDHECRPYELGWLLYAWLPAPTDGATDA